MERLANQFSQSNNEINFNKSMEATRKLAPHLNVEHNKMKFKSHIPFISVPFSIIALSLMAIPLFQSNQMQFKDVFLFLFYGTFCCIWLLSGIIKWNKPYIIADDNTLTIHGRLFSNKATLAIPWSEIKRHRGRSLSVFKIESFEKKTVKIPINGISEKALNTLLSLIETKTKKAQQIDGSDS